MSPKLWFVALAHSHLGQIMQTSKWDFALVETVHLLALATLGGSVLIIDLRLLGLVLKGESARTIGKDLGRILLGSLVLMIVSGVMLLSEEALKCYYSPAFRWKMTLLLLAVVFYFTLHRKALQRTGKEAPTIWSRAVAIISITLWLGVGIAGRAIGLI
ncbi:hypothetical protein SAMN05421771_2389 [Granulicella pectinivorans]|uniref:DUF6644 domain-containing protein n=1 Tax=Granulicella pectinivorans TaxID=474950 RepID=A0A1I6MDV9_9BACT|nr:hypothetical protein SAMN05421771_2389 [Granulicella pectinivorans]